MAAPPTASTADPPVRFDVPAVSGRHRIAVVGCGAIAGVHLEAYRDAGYDVVALCDVDEERAAARREEFYPEASVYTDHEELLAREEVDVVDVTTPLGPRPGIVRDCLETGHHVLSQKPFVGTLETGRDLVDLAERRGLALAVNQNGRWSPDVGYARAAIEGDAIGEPYGIYVTRCWDFSYIAGDDIPHRLLAHYMIHWFDMVRWLLPGREATAVHARTARAPGQRPSQPIVGQSIVEFDDATVSLTFDGNARQTETHEIRLCGSKGTILSRGPDLDDRTVTLHRSNAPTIPVNTTGQWFPDAFRGTMGSLLAAIDDGRTPPHSGADNLKTLELVFGAIESARRQGRVAPGGHRGLEDGA